MAIWGAFPRALGHATVKTSVQFEFILNLVWVLLGALALCGTAQATCRRVRPLRGSAWLHIIGVALVIAALFPFISATDDILRIEQIKTHQQDPYSSQRGPNDDLLRLYQVMDTPVVGTISEISLTLFFVLLVVNPLIRRIERSAPFESGRSPPVCC